MRRITSRHRVSTMVAPKVEVVEAPEDVPAGRRVYRWVTSLEVRLRVILMKRQLWRLMKVVLAKEIRLRGSVQTPGGEEAEAPEGGEVESPDEFALPDLTLEEDEPLDQATTERFPLSEGVTQEEAEGEAGGGVAPGQSQKSRWR